MIINGNFWKLDQSQILSCSCLGNSRFIPGCWKSTDPGGESSVTLTFPVGL